MYLHEKYTTTHFTYLYFFLLYLNTYICIGKLKNMIIEQYMGILLVSIILLLVIFLLIILED